MKQECNTLEISIFFKDGDHIIHTGINQFENRLNEKIIYFVNLDKECYIFSLQDIESIYINEELYYDYKRFEDNLIQDDDQQQDDQLMFNDDLYYEYSSLEKMTIFEFIGVMKKLGIYQTNSLKYKVFKLIWSYSKEHNISLNILNRFNTPFEEMFTDSFFGCLNRIKAQLQIFFNGKSPITTIDVYNFCIYDEYVNKNDIKFNISWRVF